MIFDDVPIEEIEGMSPKQWHFLGPGSSHLYDRVVLKVNPGSGSLSIALAKQPKYSVEGHYLMPISFVSNWRAQGTLLFPTAQPGEYIKVDTFFLGQNPSKSTVKISSLELKLVDSIGFGGMTFEDAFKNTASLPPGTYLEHDGNENYTIGII